MVIEGAFGTVTSRKTQVESIINKGTAEPCIPTLFTIHYSLFTKTSSTGGF